MRLPLIIFMLFITSASFSQNVGIGTSNPNTSAILELNDTLRGFLPPRMTFAQRNTINNPAQGLIIYCTDCDSSGQVQVFNGTRWSNLLGGIAASPLPPAANLPSVTIGTQIWSLKNLDIATYRNGDPIPQVTDPTQWANLTTGAWCWYNNDSATYGPIYGRLYNWYAVNDPRGLAPQGWHVPTNSEWNKLIKYLDSNADTTCQGCTPSYSAGGAMKSINGWNNPNVGATNSSGFTALPGGYRYGNNGVFEAVVGYGGWWIADEYSLTGAIILGFGSYNSYIDRSFNISKKLGSSVRLIKN